MKAQTPYLDSLNVQIGKTLSPKEHAQTLIALLKAYRFLDIQSGLKYGEQALIATQNLNDKAGELLVCQEMSKCFMADGKLKQAIELAQKGRQIAQSMGDKKNEALCHALEGYLHRRLGEIDFSLKSYNTCYNLSKTDNFPLGIGEAHKGFGDLNEKNGQYEKAIENYTQALKLARQAGNKELEMATLNATGIIYDYQGNLEKGLELYLHAVKIAEEIGNLIKLADYSSNIASIEFYLKHDSSALAYYQKSLELSRKTFNKFGEVSACQGIVTVYNSMKQYDEAKKYAEYDLKLRKDMNDVRGMAYAYKNLGVIYKNQNDFVKSEAYYLEGLKYAEQTDQKIKIAVLNLELGRLMNTIHQPKRAENYLKQTIALTKEMGVLREQSFAYEDLAVTYEQANRMKEAFDAQKQFTKLNDSLLTKDLNEQTVKMQTVYETKNKELKINSLEHEAQLNEALIKKSNLARNLSFVAATLLLLLAGVFYNRYRLKQKSNEILAEKNTEIQKQSTVIQSALSEKETLLREIHHRVKNNLQIISSLLNIQSENINDPSVLSSIREGQNRVQAMSLIHQNLYQSEHLSNVDIENYLKELVVYLSDMFAKEGKDIKVEVAAEHINFDIDTAIPLGLIVNELVSNAYKYAFEQQSSGNIRIGIKALNDEDFELHVDDDGKGLPPDFNPNKGKSLGLKLVNILSRQLRGKFSTAPSEGASFVVKFKDMRVYNAHS